MFQASLSLAQKAVCVEILKTVRPRSCLFLGLGEQYLLTQENWSHSAI